MEFVLKLNIFCHAERCGASILIAFLKRFGFIFLLGLFILAAGPVPATATSFHQEDMVCGNCGQISTQRILSGFFFPFVPDMDLQPLQLMLRAADLRECPHCGYVAADFSAPAPQAVREALISREYADIATLPVPDTARRFLRAALLEKVEGNYLAAGLNMSDAAWLCAVSEERWKTEMERLEIVQREGEKLRDRDWYSVDIDDLPKPLDLPPLPPETTPELAVRAAEYRGQATALLEKAVDKDQLGQESRFFVPYLLAELNRRAGDFDAARKFISRSRELFKDEPGDLRETYSVLLDYEEKLIGQKDSSRQLALPIYNKMR